ncbi:MAG TPA: hypothetical protein PLW44_08215 [Chitinophagales bacterium]|nr:hypothetical protein [Chitinophagales bacterium]
MKYLCYCLLLLTIVPGCKIEPGVLPTTLNHAGYYNEIDTYHPGTYWTYYWQESDMTGHVINSGTDVVTVADDTSVAGRRTLTGTVNGRDYTGYYYIDNNSVIFQGNSGNYFLYAHTRILFDSTQIITDHPLSGPERGCTMNLEYTNQPNVSLQIDSETFITVLAKQNTWIGNDNGGCESGYEIVNYVPRLGEVYRETSWAHNSNFNFRIRFTRKLKSYSIAH